MDHSELMRFYAIEGTKEWKAVLGNKSPSEVDPQDFAHAEFCTAANRYMLFQILKRNLTSERAENRYWAGLRLYQYWEINSKLLADWN
jgi:hypothetical protein